MAKKLCLVTGVGEGTGTALVNQFAQKGYEVAMIARNGDRLDEIAKRLPNTHAFICDVADREKLAATLDDIKAKLGPIGILIHNAVAGSFGDFLTTDPEFLETGFKVNVMALLQLARFVAPDMMAAGSGAIIATGNGAAYRGKAGATLYAPTKAAQRILLEGIARHLGPKGVHAAYVAIDAVVDLPWQRENFPDKPDGFFCKPVDIASEVYHIAHQPKSAWSFDTVIRPADENW